MKNCSWCGAEYPDDVVLCPIDRREVVGPALPESAAPYPGIRVILLNLRGDPPPVQPPLPCPILRESFELFFRYIVGLIVSGIIAFIVSLCLMALCFIVLTISEKLYYLPQIAMVLAVCAVGMLASCIGLFFGTLVLPRANVALDPSRLSSSEQRIV